MKKKCLIIEDEEHIANAERMILESDFDVHVANNGKDGLEKANNLNPDLVILDIMMPGMDGFEVARELRKNSFDGKIVMVTAKDQEHDEQHGMKTADDYIMKPFEPLELMHVVNQVLKDV